MVGRLRRLIQVLNKDGDSQEQKFRKEFIAASSLMGLVMAAFLAAAMHAQTALTGQPTHIISDFKIGACVLVCISALLYGYVWGVTSYFKILFALILFSVLVLAALTGRSNDMWHLFIILLLDYLIIVQSDRDERICRMLSIGILIGFVVYVFFHVFSNDGRGPQIHMIDYPVEYHASSQLFCSVLPVLLNFILVNSYARDLRLEAKRKSRDVEMASCIARALANFDLDEAAELMLEASIHKGGGEHTRSPVHEPLALLLCNLRVYRPFLPNYLFERDQHGDPTDGIISAAISGMPTSWTSVQMAVERLRDPDYSLRDFHKDMDAAFPELRLYSLEARANSRMSSGHSGSDEYRRTLGALYSVYCIARLDMDGKEIFSFGVDKEGKPLAAPKGEGSEKRQAFYRSMEWDAMMQLFVRAGLLVYSTRVGHSTSHRPDKPPLKADEEIPMGHGSSHGSSLQAQSLELPGADEMRKVPTGADGMLKMSSAAPELERAPSKWSAVPEFDAVRVDAERMTALLVLTAIHDIMKNTVLLPEVHRKHAPYHGVAEGCKIQDHDLALTYLMEHYAGLLPSFSGLEPGQRAVVFFSHGKMGFNNGWLVQGEAPPGALFSAFKEVITLGGASEADISFYFAHWLTDLAGAEPFGLDALEEQFMPWPGSEKFVLKFPLKVLVAFLDSFVYVNRLSFLSEVQVMEEYLQHRWMDLGCADSEVSGDRAVARMRLALMAQGFERAATSALEMLPAADCRLLAAELARTGMRAQFSSAPVEVSEKPAGPALLVYYAPALIQKAGAGHVRKALLVLSAVCRAARELWPLEKDMVERTVVVRIDALKVLTPLEISAAGTWLLRKMSPHDAVVECAGQDRPAPSEERQISVGSVRSSDDSEAVVIKIPKLEVEAL